MIIIVGIFLEVVLLLPQCLSFNVDPLDFLLLQMRKEFVFVATMESFVFYPSVIWMVFCLLRHSMFLFIWFFGEIIIIIRKYEKWNAICKWKLKLLSVGDWAISSEQILSRHQNGKYIIGSNPLKAKSKLTDKQKNELEYWKEKEKNPSLRISSSRRWHSIKMNS